VAAKQQINRETHRDIRIPIKLLAASSLRAHLIIAAVKSFHLIGLNRIRKANRYQACQQHRQSQIENSSANFIHRDSPAK
jgi:hypothetical protein